MRLERFLLFLFSCFAIFGIAQATTVTTTRNLQDANGTKIQGHADNGKKEQALTGVKTNAIDMSNDVSWKVTTASGASDCKYMSLSTATIPNGAIRKILPGGQMIVMPVNRITPFMVYSGCTGDLSRM